MTSMTLRKNHHFKTVIDNPTIGLLICKDKDNVVAKYALESYKEPMGISEYQLSKLFPKDFKSSMPTIEELEKGLKDNQKQTTISTALFLPNKPNMPMKCLTAAIILVS